MWQIVTGFLVGYFMGTKAGREQYAQLQQALHTIVTSETFHTAIREGSVRVADMTSPDGLKRTRELLVGRAVELVDKVTEKPGLLGPRPRAKS